MNKDNLIGGELERCPPDIAKPTKGEFFRILFHGESEKSWHSRLKLNRDKTDDKCREAAVSMMTSEAAVKKARRLIPSFKKKKVARIEISLEDGVVEADKPHHVNWWHTVSHKPHLLAEAVNI